MFGIEMFLVETAIRPGLAVRAALPDVLEIHDGDNSRIRGRITRLFFNGKEGYGSSNRFFIPNDRIVSGNLRIDPAGPEWLIGSVVLK